MGPVRRIAMAAVGADVVALALPLPKAQVEQATHNDEQQDFGAAGKDVPRKRAGGRLLRLLGQFDGGLGHVWLPASGIRLPGCRGGVDRSESDRHAFRLGGC